MGAEDNEISLDFLDHLVIRIKTLKSWVAWYENVLGLKKHQMPEWGAFPIFLLSGKTGVALFPAKLDDTQLELNSKKIKIDHFAFKLTRAIF